MHNGFIRNDIDTHTPKFLEKISVFVSGSNVGDFDIVSRYLDSMLSTYKKDQLCFYHFGRNLGEGSFDVKLHKWLEKERYIYSDKYFKGSFNDINAKELNYVVLFIDKPLNMPKLIGFEGKLHIVPTKS